MTDIKYDIITNVKIIFFVSKQDFSSAEKLVIQTNNQKKIKEF